MMSLKYLNAHTSRLKIQQTVVVLSASVFALVLIAFFMPLAVAVAPVFYGGNPAPVLKTLFKAARFTLLQAFLSAAGASCIGLCAAFFCARREFFGRTALLSLSAIPLSVPPVVIALAFILFFGKNGALNRVLLSVSAGRISTGTFLYSTGGVLLVHSFYNFPITMRTVSAVWEQLPEETEQAACLLGAPPLRIFKTIIFPALKAPFFASFVIIFLYCFFSFVIILLLGGLGVTTLEVELYQTIRTNVHASAAAWIAVLETGIAGAVVALYAYLRSRSFDHVENTQYIRLRSRLGGVKERLIFTALICCICFCLLLPLGSLLLYSLSTPDSALSEPYSTFGFVRSLSFRSWRQLLQRPSFWGAVRRTVQIGIGTSFFSVAAALFFAYLSFFLKRSWYKSLPLFPFAVSPIILGSGWLKLDILPSAFMLIIVQSSLAWPFAWVQIETVLAKIPCSTVDAARLLSASRSDAFFRTFLPLCKAGIVPAFCCVFAISAGDASLPILLHIPEFENLALMLFRFAGAYRFTESSSIAVILAALTGLLFFIQDSVRNRI